MQPPNESSVILAMNLTESSDEQLLRLIKGSKAQQKHAMGELYRRHQAEILRVVGWGLSSADAHDLVATLWVDFYYPRLRNEFEWQGTPIVHWLLSVARRKRLEFLRQQGENSCLPLQDEILKDTCDYIDAVFEEQTSSSDVSSLVKAKADQLVHKSLEQLKDKPREIIQRFYFQNQDCHEIAGLLDMTHGAVRTALSRARDKLKGIIFNLEKRGDSDE